MKRGEQINTIISHVAIFKQYSNKDVIFSVATHETTTVVMYDKMSLWLV